MKCITDFLQRIKCIVVNIYIGSTIIIPVALTLVILPEQVFSQIESAIWGGKLFVKKQGVWFQQGNSGQDFIVDTNTITIKYKEGVPISTISLFEQEMGLLKKRQNRHFYIDYKIPTGVDILSFCQTLGSYEIILSLDINTFGAYVLNPNDPLYSSQWYLNQIDIPNAWDISTGNNSIIVGILDSGTDWTHEDIGKGSDIPKYILK